MSITIRGPLTAGRAVMSLRSMTAFAARDDALAEGRLGWELRSVNHRFLELNLRLPDDFRALEPKLRDRAVAKIARGKVDITLRWRPAQAGASTLSINEPLAAELARLSLAISRLVPDLAPGTRFDALSWPGLVVEPERELGGVQEAALASFDAALEDFVATREREGARLLAVMRDRLDAIERIVAQVREWMPGIREALRERLRARLAELGTSVDPARFEQELVLGLSKLDVEEELDRLAGHVEETRRIFARGEAAGRRLDFLLQEFNREANTLASKSVDARTSQAGVELKVLIEQLREQVQNLE